MDWLTGRRTPRTRLQRAAAELARKRELPQASGVMLADPNGAINLSLGIRDEQYSVGSAAVRRAASLEL